ncbi:hypothetical protein CB1_000529011 [Camelus ferus]|nr:hypothetical protein CB1_000529011 [Camelus ferus]
MTSQLERLSVACMGSRLQEPFLFRVDVVLGAAFLEDFDPFTWQQLEEEAAKPPEPEKPVSPPPVEQKHRSIVQIIYDENRSCLAVGFQKPPVQEGIECCECCGGEQTCSPKLIVRLPCRAFPASSALFTDGFACFDARGKEPLYNQPSDTKVYHENIKALNDHLLAVSSVPRVILQREQEGHMALALGEPKVSPGPLWQQEEQKICQRYDQLMEAWEKKVDRMENNPRRKARESKTREYYEKQFPEIRKQREQQERFQRENPKEKDKTDGAAEETEEREQAMPRGRKTANSQGRRKGRVTRSMTNEAAAASAAAAAATEEPPPPLPPPPEPRFEPLLCVCRWSHPREMDDKGKPSINEHTFPLGRKVELLMSLMSVYLSASRKPREERDVSQCESVASTVSAQEDEDIEASNEEENPEDSEGISDLRFGRSFYEPKCMMFCFVT